MVVSVDELPGIHGAERDNRRGIELFVADSIGESLMATAYLLMEKDGLLETVFYESVPTLSEFLGWLQRPNSKYLGCFVRKSNVGQEDVLLAGLVWLWNIGGPKEGVKAECGIVFLKEFQHSHIPEELTDKAISYAFTIVDVLYGVTPVQNRAATLFSRKIGFRQTEPLPKYGSYHGEPTDVVISYLTRQDWEDKQNGRWA